MALLKEAPPKVIFFCLSILGRIKDLPKHTFGGHKLVDKPLCSALYRNPDVLVPLLRFALLNGAESPASDHELLAVMAVMVFRQTCQAAGKRPVAICSVLLPPGR